MKTQTRTQAGAGARTDITPGAAAIIAIPDPTRSAIVARADDAIVVRDEHTAHPALHAIGALGSERGESHEVSVPRWAEAGGGDDVECAEGGVEGCDRGEVVEDVEVGA